MSTDPARASVFDVSTWEKKAKTRPETTEPIRRVAEDNGFTSRHPANTPPAAVPGRPAPSQPAPPQPTPPAPARAADRVSRRARTGRNRQLNIKMTEATANRMATLADTYGLVYGELIDQALDAFEREIAIRVAT